MDIKDRPSYRKPEQNISMVQFAALVARVETLEKELAEKRGRKAKTESED
jgi:hypothetical protein